MLKVSGTPRHAEPTILMNNWIEICISVFIIAALATWALIPQILRIAHKQKLYDPDDPRKIHKGSVPRLGGVSFFPSILFAIMITLGLAALAGDAGVLRALHSDILPLIFIACALASLSLVGLADDLVGVKYREKFVVQIFSAILIVMGGTCLTDLQGLCGLHDIPVWAAVALTILVTVFITNAMNLIDGIDGLSSGIAMIACGFYCYVFFKNLMYIYALLSVATIGTLMPFFFFNVFGSQKKRTKIFMGDTGSMTLGLILSVLSIRVSMISGESHFNFGVLAFAPLLIPCFDVIRVYFGRLRRHTNPFLPDNTHIHHKLLALGLSQRQALVCIIGCSAALTTVNYWLSEYVDITLLMAGDLLAWTAANMMLTAAIRRKNPSALPKGKDTRR